MKMKTKHNLMRIGLLCAALLPAVAQAQFAFTTNDDNTITITGYTGAGGTVAIPDTTNGYPVTAIADYAFWGNSTLTNLTIPSSVTNIGVMEFQNCSGLTNVTVADANPNYASAGGVLFDKAITTVLQCPGGLAGSYTIPNGVTSITNNAFEYCARLSGVTIPSSVTNLGTFVFGGWSSRLSTITVDGANPSYASTGGILFNKAKTTLIQFPPQLDGSYLIPSSVTNIGDYAFIYSTLWSVTIPNGVLSIGYESFWNDPSLTTVAIPDSVVSIGVTAFYACQGLRSVTLGSGVASIGNQAFSDCSGLTNFTVAVANPNYASAGGVLFDKAMTTLLQCPTGLASYAIPNGVTTIADNAFSSCYSLTNVTIGSSVTSIGENAFYNCSYLKSVTIPNNVGSIGWEAFGDCYDLTNVTLGSGVTSIADAAFYGCSSLTTVTIPASVTSLGSSCFLNCPKLTQAYFQGDAPLVDGWIAGSDDNSVFSGETGTAYYLAIKAGWDTTFGGWPAVAFVPFAYIYITNTDNTITITGCTGAGGDVSIPDTINGLTVTGIGAGAFQHNRSLTSVTIPAGITNLGSLAFSDCTSLTAIYFLGNAPTADLTVFAGDNHAIVYYLPHTTGWSSPFAGLLAAQQNPPSPAGDFYYTTINGAITITGYHGVGGDIGIPSTINGLTVVGIGDGAFDYNYNLTSVTIPNSVTNLGGYPFYDCGNLTSVTIGNGVTSIGYSAFAVCGSLTNVMIGKSVTSIGDWAFEDCGSPLTIVCLGNAPQADDWTAVFNDDMGTIYYLPDTTGWSSQFADLTAVLWTAPAPPVTPVTLAYTYITNSDNTITITGCTGSGDVTIPDTFNGLTVSSIANGAFQHNGSLTSITIPAGIINLGSSAFADCTNLTGIYFLGDAPGTDLTVFADDNHATIYYLPGMTGWSSPFDGLLAEVQNPVAPAGDFTYTTNNNLITITGYTGVGGDIGIPGTITGLPVVSIGDDAFKYISSLTSVTIPASVTNIGAWAFEDCQTLTRILLGNNVTRIGTGAFYGCNNLTNATIGNNVTIIGDYPFTDCSSLTAIAVTALNSNYSSLNGVLFTSGQTTLIQFPGGLGGSYTIPDSVSGIEEYAFQDCTGLTNVTMGNDLLAIGMGAFWGCNGLTTVAIPNNVTSIGQSAFGDCSGLTNVTLGNSVASIGDGAFWGCSGLTTIAIPASVWSIEDDTFYDCSGLTVITVDPANLYYCSPNGVLLNHSQTTLIQYPEAKAGSYTIPSSVTSLAYSAFNYCTNLTSLTIGNHVPSIGNYQFDGCSRLASVIIGNSVTNLGFDAFVSCTSLASVTIPGQVTSIGSEAFEGDSSLTNVLIPATVTSIGSRAFLSCPSLIAITVDSLNPVYSSLNGVLFDVSRSTLLQFPGGLGGSYTIPATVTNIGVWSFGYSPNLGRVTIPDNVLSIGVAAFASCCGLTNATIGNGVTSIPEAAFINCPLTSVSIGTNVVNIGDEAFTGCPLTSITIPNSVTSIGYQVFADNSSLTNLILGNSVTNIGQNAFSFCTHLARVTFPASLTSLGDEAFYYCTNLTGAYFLGNLPSSRDWFQFYYDNNATVYYLPVSTGWTSQYGTRPTAQWTPPPQISVAGFGLHKTQFGFNLTGFNSQVIVVEASTNLRDWQPLQTNTLTGGAATFSDPQWTNYPGRFYRLRSP